MSRRICLVAGHGAGDPGAIAFDGRHEADLTRQVVNAMASRLSELNVNHFVYPTNQNLFASQDYRLFDSKDDVIEVHFNAFGDPSAHGTETFVPNGQGNDAVSLNIHDSLVGVGFRGRRVEAANFRVINALRQRGARARLVEICFATNQSDMERYDREFDQIVEGLVAVMVGQGALPNVTEPTPVPTQPASPTSVDTLAREVINGVWGNGDDRTRRLREAGHNPVEVQRRVNEIIGAGNSTPSPPSPPVANTPSLDDIARQVIRGEWGNGDDRSTRLRKAGFDPAVVQRRVNELVGSANSTATPTPPRQTVDQVARRVINGEFGNGDDRVRRLREAGHDPTAVQRRVNEMMR